MDTSSMYKTLNRNLINPTDKESFDDILAIDRQTKEDCRLRHNLFVERDWESNTLTYIVLEMMISALYGNIVNNGVQILSPEMDNSFDFYDLLEIAASYKRDDNAEKTGNINVKFLPGARVAELVNDDTDLDKIVREFADPKAAYIYKDDENMTSAMKKIDSLARKRIKDKYDIIIPVEWYSIAVAYNFMECFFRYLGWKTRMSEKKQVMINFNDLIEVYGQKGKKGVEVFLRPGMAAKLIIKSDATTEDDD